MIDRGRVVSVDCCSEVASCLVGAAVSLFDSAALACLLADVWLSKSSGQASETAELCPSVGSRRHRDKAQGTREGTSNDTNPDLTFDTSLQPLTVGLALTRELTTAYLDHPHPPHAAHSWRRTRETHRGSPIP